MNTTQNTIKTTLQTLALGLALAAFALPAAQAGNITASHTWVSSMGNDNNGNGPCSRTAPCLTFAGALTATNPGGIVSVIDSGDYGPMTISQNVTVDGTGSNAAITVATGNAVTIPIASSVTVTLRHLTLTGPGGSSTTGISQGGGSLLVDGCKITGFSRGVDAGDNSSRRSLVVQNTTITNCGAGISGITNLLSVRDSTIQGCGYGVSLLVGLVDMSRCTIAQNRNFGLGGTGVPGNAPILTATGCTFSGNGTAISAGDGATINLNDNDVWNNTTGFATFGSGIIATAGNNRKAGNTTPGAPTPGATVTVQ